MPRPKAQPDTDTTEPTVEERDAGELTPVAPSAAVERDAGSITAEPTGDQPAPLVDARWVGPAVYNPEHGLILHGDPIKVTPEQLADPNTPAVRWDDGWEYDPAVIAATPPDLLPAALRSTDEEG